MKKLSYQTLFLVALPLAFAAGCAHTEREAIATFDPIPAPPMAPTSDRSEARVYANSAGAEAATTAPTGANPDDWALAEKVRAMLTENPKLGGAPVAVVVNKGTVTLHGAVRTRSEREKVRKAVAAVPGVQKVDDQLEIKNSAGSVSQGESKSY
jgi:hypothetical protein